MVNANFPKFKSKKKQSLYNECSKRKYYVVGWSYQITKTENGKYQATSRNTSESYHQVMYDFDDTYQVNTIFPFLTEYEKEIVNKEIETVVGLDFAMDGLFVDSETGEKANYPKFLSSNA